MSEIGPLRRYDWRGAARAVLAAINPGRVPSEDELRKFADLLMQESEIMADMPFVEIKRNPE